MAGNRASTQTALVDASPSGSAVGFLDLAAELRNTIYDLVLVVDGVIDPIKEQRQPTITRTCRQVREESLPLYYSSNTFELREFCYSCNYTSTCYEYRKKDKRPRPAKWLAAICYENLRRIRTLRFTCAKRYDEYDLTIKQTRTGGLTCTPDSRWMEYYDGEMCEGRPERSKLGLLLHEMSDRKVQPGLSPCGIRKLISFVTKDYHWFGLSEKERKEQWKCDNMYFVLDGNRTPPEYYKGMDVGPINWDAAAELDPGAPLTG